MRLLSQSLVRVFIHANTKHPRQLQVEQVRSWTPLPSGHLPAQLVYWHFLPRTLSYTFWSPDLSLLCSPHLESLLLVTPPICTPPLHQSCCHIAFSPQSSLYKPRPVEDPRSSSSSFCFCFCFAFIECLLNISFCKVK